MIQLTFHKHCRNGLNSANFTQYTHALYYSPNTALYRKVGRSSIRQTICDQGLRDIHVFQSHFTQPAIVKRFNLNSETLLEFITSMPPISVATLQWRHNEHDGVSDHQPHDCLLNRLFRRSSKKISKLRVTGLCVWNSPMTGEFPAQRASNADDVSIWWRHHVNGITAPPWINNYVSSNLWDEITSSVEVWEWIRYFIPQFIRDTITFPCWD